MERRRGGMGRTIEPGVMRRAWERTVGPARANYVVKRRRIVELFAYVHVRSPLCAVIFGARGDLIRF